MIGYAIDSVKNKILEIDTSQPPQDSFRSKIGYNIAKFFQEHKRTGEVIAATIRIGVQSVVAFAALAVNPVYMVQALIDLTITIVQNAIPAVGNWIEKHPIITQIVVTTITLAAQLTVGISTGSLPLALFTMVLTLGTQIMVSSYGQSIAGWCVAKILNRKTEENNVVLSVKEQDRIDKAKECIEKAQEPIGRIGNAVSNLIVGVYGVVNKLYSKTVSAVVSVVLGCNLKNPENQAGDSDGQNVTNAKKTVELKQKTEQSDKTAEMIEQKDDVDGNVKDNHFKQILEWLEEKLQQFADKYRAWAYTEETSKQQSETISNEIKEQRENFDSTELATDHALAKYCGFAGKMDEAEEKLQKFTKKHNPFQISSDQMDQNVQHIAKELVSALIGTFGNMTLVRNSRL